MVENAKYYYNRGMRMDHIKRNLDLYYYDMNYSNKDKSKDVSEWIHKSREYDKISDLNSKNRDEKKHHPVKVKKRAIYVIDFGKNVGKEFEDLHLGLVIQNDIGNLYGDNVIVLPITDFKSKDKYNPKLHHKIWNSYFESVTLNGLDKDPSKVKISDITTVDKARFGRMVGIINKTTYNIIIEKLCKILEIPIDK